MKHDAKPTGIAVDPVVISQEKTGKVYVLLKDGRLTGPFPSVADARYWLTSLGLEGFSTYDLINPSDVR